MLSPELSHDAAVGPPAHAEGHDAGGELVVEGSRERDVRHAREAFLQQTSERVYPRAHLLGAEGALEVEGVRQRPVMLEGVKAAGAHIPAPALPFREARNDRREALMCARMAPDDAGAARA